jgi:transcriptional regulator of acetoin/glycerol metabolism
MREASPLVPTAFPSPPELRRLAPRMRRAWEVFVTDGTTPTPEIVRPSIVSRWHAAAGSGLDPLLPRVPLAATEEELEPLFLEDDFARAGRRVLEDMSGVVAENEHALFLTDAGGCVLHVTGAPSVVEALRDLNARGGGRWDETAAGPNGMGTALFSGRPAVVFGAEHFCQRWQPWVCYGAPVRDPVGGQILGVVNLTGWAEKAKANQLPLAIGLARSVEYLLVGSRGSWRQALLDLGRELAARYASDGILLCDGAGNVLQVNARVHDLLRRRRATMAELLSHPKVAELMKGGADEDEAVASLRGGRLYVAIRSTKSGGRRMGVVLVLHEAPSGLAVRAGESAPGASPFTDLDGGSLRAIERELLRRTIEDCAGNTSAAARRLGIHRSTIYRRTRRGRL